jgi:hypothetical protein
MDWLTLSRFGVTQVGPILFAFSQVSSEMMKLELLLSPALPLLPLPCG